MSDRFSGSSRSLSGSRETLDSVPYQFTYNNYQVEFQWYEIPELYLISISLIPKTPLPLLEFSISIEDLGGLGVVKYIESLLDELDLLRGGVIEKMKKLFPKEKTFTDERIAAFMEMRRRKIY